jgi:peptide deformylase
MMALWHRLYAPAVLSVDFAAKHPYLRPMAILPILEVPDPRLKTISSLVEAFDDDLKRLVDDMFETMYEAPGIGLAAIQVGVPKRVLVIDLQEEKDGETVKNPRVFVNPEILEAMDDLMATCLQHEMDHLEGILFIDHLSRLKRQMVLKKIEKARKMGGGHVHGEHCNH